MTLSNIFKEPRREITEQLVGLGIVGGVIGSDFWLTNLFFPYANFSGTLLVMAEFLVGGGMVLFFSYLIMLGIHTIGEKVCNLFEKAGFHLRPRNRPTQIITGTEIISYNNPAAALDALRWVNDIHHKRVQQLKKFDIEPYHKV